MNEAEMARLAAQWVQTGMDPTSADGRAGLGALLREFDHRDPGVLRRLGHEIQARRGGAGQLARR